VGERYLLPLSSVLTTEDQLGQGRVSCSFARAHGPIFLLEALGPLCSSAVIFFGKRPPPLSTGKLVHLCMNFRPSGSLKIFRVGTCLAVGVRSSPLETHTNVVHKLFYLEIPSKFVFGSLEESFNISSRIFSAPP